MLEFDFSNPIFQSYYYIVLFAMAPVLLVSITCFTRYVIVLSLLRTALGLQQTPPNIVIISICLFMTFFTMEPIFSEIKGNSYDLYINNLITQDQATQAAVTKLNDFLESKSGEQELGLVSTIREASYTDFSGLEKTIILVPAFILSELKVAFQFAFLIFIPFLLVDLIVASVLMALGMIMLPPVSISLPIKLLIFLLIDGWGLLVQGLINGFLN